MIPNKQHAHKDGVVLAVARSLGVTVDDVTCAKRDAWRVLTRYGIAYALRNDHHWSWDDISTTINRERTTTYYAVETAQLLMDHGNSEQKTILARVRETVAKHMNSLPQQEP